MIKALFLTTLLFSNNLLACAYAGTPPSVDDLINKFDLHYENSEEILMVKVISRTPRSNDFKIIAVYKSAKSPNDIFTYYDQTDCDMTFKTLGEVYIIFGSIFDDTLSIFDANAMRSDHPKYNQLQDLLESYGN